MIVLINILVRDICKVRQEQLVTDYIQVAPAHPVTNGQTEAVKRKKLHGEAVMV